MLDVILLEDEAVLREELTEFLVGCGYRIDAESTLAGFHRRFDPRRHSIAILDIGLPDGDGLTLIRELRARGEHIGIVVFTARGEARDRISGLDIGADHYLAKTLDLDELAATLAALGRRLEVPNAVQADTWVLEQGPRNLHPPRGRAIALSEQDLTVLQELMCNAGSLVSRRQIIEALGEDFFSYDQRRLDTQMRRLRRKVDELSGLTLPINTARNQGYRFHAKALVNS
ncbi:MULTISPECIES: response regulator transcription factor [Comamonas]|jgi:DNA-binding response OmpR family regulator|uniref:DNA-binding response regulator n=1 Tax=Comamonas terrigena TaxID=32013 RepID=A0A2A7UVH0_COMTR|nr:MULTISPECIES: response regulator transcription factor [Comamonas]MBD9530525.1 response regulator transcription factor [Comamonas sp. CMM01]PEH89196.1 DNA-binding response regulator [Comamonas terrigena]BBL24312.1 transcriptional regulator [Comamonas terrigena NBRC 13299]SUY72089.1 Transcriptional regulatory protein CssR [Comamonas terrigena]